jgi:hypothetical protein
MKAKTKQWRYFKDWTVYRSNGLRVDFWHDQGWSPSWRNNHRTPSRMEGHKPITRAEAERFAPGCTAKEQAK